MNLFDYLNTATSSLFRFEGLQEYRVGKEDDEEMSEWWDFVEQKTKAGIVMERVRLVVLPLNDYTKRELETHRKSVEKGDNIKILTMDKYVTEKNLAVPPDFWVIDNKTVLVMNYSETGEYKGFVVDENVETYLRRKELLLKVSVPIDDFFSEGLSGLPF